MPPLRIERPYAPRRGYVWVPGFWQWAGMQYVWIEGHWGPLRRGRRF